jgi:integrase
MDGKGYAANRAYEVLRTFFKWLEYDEHVTVDPMHKVRKPWNGEQPRERFWTDDELRRIWLAADKLDNEHEATYLKLLLLLGQRRDEVAGIRWDELDLDGKRDPQFKGPTWQLPVERGKSKRVHTFPLPSTAVQLLTSLPKVDSSPYVFPGRRGALSIGSKVQARVQKHSGVSDFTFHDARRTFRTGLDRLNIAPHVKDECLNHARRGVGDKHYSQYTYLPEQLSAFQAWDHHIGNLIGKPKNNVDTTLKKRRAGKRQNKRTAARV